MNLKEYFIKNRNAGSYISVCAFIMGLASIIVYLIYSTSIEKMFLPGVLVLLIIATIGELVMYFLDFDFIPIITSGCSVAALGYFLMSPPETIGSIVDYYQDIVMFGYPDKYPIILTVVILILLMSVLSVISGFFKTKV